MQQFHRLDETHDPALQSWVESANDPATDFPLQNLPFGRFRADERDGWHIGVAIGDQVLDLRRAGFIATDDMRVLMALDAAQRSALRLAISRALRPGAAERQVASALHAQRSVELGLPCDIGDYTDFYVGIHHAMSVGRQFRPDSPLLPNYKWMPIGYHGRASSIGVSGESFARPRGQTRAPDLEAPRMGPTQQLDYELEVGMFIGAPNPRGCAVDMAHAESHVFGLTLLNDWSARDIQRWEYQPLGPFLSKNFATTVSPWIVTLDALAPFRKPFVRPAGDPQPLPYLDANANRAAGAIDITLEVWLQSAKMRQADSPGELLSRGSFTDAYWTVAQLVAHHTVNGCNLRTADLLGSGTISGPAANQGGSLLELSQGGKRPVPLANGETRGFLEDGDSIILRGFCEGAGARRIGFGECRGTVLPAMAA